ncbi:hypothetical protein NLY43_08275 [Mesorhizobium sp. C416B]|uniref:protein-disulfide reductase DsbD domain-containing protein n=1 Tax=unclassified Mesorhizobium TaxID=325217 RepID=UPI0003CDD4EE|nr:MULTISPECIES: protein-disulfide reductase DsbD domain-containing protein [unclassified Mesorhizobium]ESX52067.1 hypothetical protein X762_01170 [Mesorhizobium sp. LSHC426A00]ESX59022.1 hypothetical protein X761_03640 [Mesorhizobium sp. LSHC424B00]ESX76112.1 hypothetical protein X758_00110 [Mesorhizobium sp. LSHC416B00]WJI64735.1 hypothetical protein NLY43_08275 [Mesorhizobium sp. C416B]
MQSLKILLLGIAIGCGAVLPAAASSSEWYNSEGGKVRLVTTGKADEAGRIQGVLDIALKPGWKTYWRDPGDAGVPPQIDVSASTNITDAAFSFPPPQRHDDGYGKWAGYNHPVSLPVTFTLSSPGDAAVIDADIFLGICETICIPVQTRLSVYPAADPDNAEDAALVKAALATLPAPAKPDFGIKVLPGDHETLMVEATFPGDPEAADLFVAGGRDYMFGAPARSEKDGRLVFTIPILDRPSTTPTDGGLYYTLTSAEGAVEGVLPFP